MGLAAKRLKRGLAAAGAGTGGARRLLDRLAATVRAAAAVFMTGMPVPPACSPRRRRRSAIWRPPPRRRISPGCGARPGDAGAAHLDLLRDLKRVNGHLVAAAAYPVLEGQGELLASRLRLDLSLR